MRLLLQEDLESARQQLHQAEQQSKVLVAAQQSEHEAAWKSSLHEGQQKLQQAHDEIAVRSAESRPQYCHLIADCNVTTSGKPRQYTVHQLPQSVEHSAAVFDCRTWSSNFGTLGPLLLKALQSQTPMAMA